MQTTPHIEKIGRRHYAIGAPFGLKDKLRDLGLSWDGEMKAWWTGKAALVPKIEALLAEPAPVVGRWIKAGKDWLVCAPEAALRTGTIKVAAKGKPIREVRVDPATVRLEGSDWVAAPVRDAVERMDRTAPIPLVGTEDGATERLRYRIEGRHPPEVKPELGRIIATEKKSDAGPRFWRVLGAESHYTTGEFEEDCGEGRMPDGWWLILHVRPATDAEAAPEREHRLAELAKRAEAQAAADAKAAAARAAWEDALARATGGFVRIAAYPDRVVATIATYSPERGEYLTLSAGDCYGKNVVALSISTGHGDMEQGWLYAPRAVCLEILDAQLAASPVSPVAAREWLARCAGCYGTELYRRAAGTDPWTGEAMEGSCPHGMDARACGWCTTGEEPTP